MSWRGRRLKADRLGKHSGVSRHHRRCRANGGTDDPRNLSFLSVKEHQAWHTLTGSMSPYQIARLFSENFLDPDYLLVAVRRDEYRVEHY